MRAGERNRIDRHSLIIKRCYVTNGSPQAIDKARTNLVWLVEGDMLVSAGVRAKDRGC